MCEFRDSRDDGGGAAAGGFTTGVNTFSSFISVSVSEPELLEA